MEYERPQALPWNVPGYHERQAAQLRVLATTATTAAMKARLMREAEKHDQLARGETAVGDEC